MANFFTNIAPNVIFSKDPTAVIDYYVQHKLLGDVCNCPTCQSSMEMATRPTTSTKDVLDGAVPTKDVRNAVHTVPFVLDHFSKGLASP